MKKIVFVLPVLIYLQTWAVDSFDLDSLQTAILEAIACQEPLLGGDAVYSARVMLGPYWQCQNYYKTTGGNETYYQSIKPKDIAANESAFISKIYPNPNDGSMRLDYSLPQTTEGKLVIFDLTGKLVKSYRLNAGNNRLQISESALKNGVYFYSVTTDEEIIYSDKLVIIH